LPGETTPVRFAASFTFTSATAKKRISLLALFAPGPWGDAFVHQLRASVPFPFFPDLSFHSTPPPVALLRPPPPSPARRTCAGALLRATTRLCARYRLSRFSRWVLVRSRRDLRGAKGELPHFRGGEDRLRILELAGISISPTAGLRRPRRRRRQRIAFACGYAS